jgi:hypothetical protein
MSEKQMPQVVVNNEKLKEAMKRVELSRELANQVIWCKLERRKLLKTNERI